MRMAIYPAQYKNANPEEAMRIAPKGIFEAVQCDADTFRFKDRLPPSIEEGDIAVIVD